MSKNKYHFEFPLEGVYVITVEADTLEDATEIAQEQAKVDIEYSIDPSLCIYYDEDNFTVEEQESEEEKPSAED